VTIEAPGDDLDAVVAEWHPTPVTTSDELAPQQAQRLADTLDVEAAFAAGDELPLLWHWVYFANWPASATLGPDGHPQSGRFMPPMRNRRRMFAGGRVDIVAPLRLGETVHRRSELVSTAVKHGRSGPMLFVTVRQTFEQSGRAVLVEERDLVYRSDSGSTTPFSAAGPSLDVPVTPWQSRPRVDEAVLFRFSALTHNTHRIHYDHRYATGTEGYPDLVVHGPLLAIYMAGLPRAHGEESAVERFEFRLSRPVFRGDPFVVQGSPGERTIDLAIRTGAGVTHASASAIRR
jgi:3-methylfumaryl-CoA hydratase